jgi:hypothetical protein
MKAVIDFDQIDRLTGFRLGTFDVACPICGPGRREPQNRIRRVLRIWRKDADFASYVCARCGEEGWARSAGALAKRRLAEECDAAQETGEVQRAGGEEAARRIGRALSLWSEASDPRGSVIERYLARRGLRLDEEVEHALRFHPALRHDEGDLPGMLGLLRDVITDEPCGVHRTFLDRDGRKLDRRMLGRAKNAAVKLIADEDVSVGIGIAEGIETALALINAGWQPVWALGSAGGIERFPVLAGIEAITIFADSDEVGLAAARACSARWTAAGREARILRPPMAGADWNDMAAA